MPKYSFRVSKKVSTIKQATVEIDAKNMTTAYEQAQDLVLSSTDDEFDWEEISGENAISDVEFLQKSQSEGNV